MTKRQALFLLLYAVRCPAEEGRRPKRRPSPGLRVCTDCECGRLEAAHELGYRLTTSEED